MGIVRLQILRRDGELGLILSSSGIGRLTVGVFPLVQIDSKGDFLIGIIDKGVGIPLHRGIFAFPNQGVLGVGGEHQGQLIAGGDSEFERIGLDVVRCLRRAVVRRVGKGDLSHGIAGQRDLTRRGFIIADCGNVLITAAPGAGLVSGIARCDGCLELGNVLIAQGDLVVVSFRLVYHADLHISDRHQSGHGGVGGEPFHGFPALAAIVHLDLDGDGLIFGGTLHRKGGCRENDVLAIVRVFTHCDRNGLLFAVAHSDQQLEGVFGICVKGAIFLVLIGFDGKLHRPSALVIAGAEACDGVFQHGSGDGDTANGNVVHLSVPVAPVIGNSARRDAHGEGTGVDLLNLVEEGDVLAAGRGMEVAERVLCVVDGDFGGVQVVHFDKFVAGDGDGDHVTAPVVAPWGGDGEGRTICIINQRITDIGSGGRICVYAVSVGFIEVAVTDLIPFHTVILTEIQVQKKIQGIGQDGGARGGGGRCGDHVVPDVRRTTAGSEVERKTA